MRPACLAPRRRATWVARLRLASGAGSRPPPACDVQPPRRLPVAREPRLAAARAGRRPALRAPLLEPDLAGAHGRSPVQAARRWSPVWSPLLCRGPPWGGSGWRDPICVRAGKVLLLACFVSLRLAGAIGLEPAPSGVTERRCPAKGEAVIAARSPLISERSGEWLGERQPANERLR